MSYEHPQYLNLKLPVIPLKSFDPDDSQLGLIRPNVSSANTVFGTSLSERGKTLLAMSNLVSTKSSVIDLGPSSESRPG